MQNENFASAPQGGDNAQRIGEFNQGIQSNHISSSTTKDFPVALTVAGGAGGLGGILGYAKWMSGKSDEQRKTGWKIIGILIGGATVVYGIKKYIDLTTKKAEIKAKTEMKIAIMKAQKEYLRTTHSEQSDVEEQSSSPTSSMTGAEIKASAKNAPSPQFLLDGIIKEGSICMLLAPEKIGKSTFVMQLVDALSKGETFCLPVNQYKNTPTDVLYYDLELDKEDYEDRYGNSSTTDKIVFVRKKDWTSVKEWLDNVKERVSASTNHIVVVVDTLSSLIGNDDESAKELNRRIKALKDSMASKGIFISFIFVCHTVKDYESWKPITAKDIRGSQLLTGLADTTLALEPTKWGNNHIMFKQIDSRKTGLEEQAFLLERIIEPGNWHFEFEKMVNEQENLPNKNRQNESTTQKRGTNESQEARSDCWQRMYDEGTSCEEIAAREGLSRQTISKHVRKKPGKGRKRKDMGGSEQKGK